MEELIFHRLSKNSVYREIVGADYEKNREETNRCCFIEFRGRLDAGIKWKCRVLFKFQMQLDSFTLAVAIIRVTEQDGGGILVKIFGINEPRASRDVTKSLADPTNTVSTSNTIISPFLLPFQHSTFIAARFTISTNCRFITVKPIIFILFFFSPTNRQDRVDRLELRIAERFVNIAFANTWKDGRKEESGRD